MATTFTRPTVAVRTQVAPNPMRVAFFWLAAFYFVYCARPEDWVPGLTYIPLAKITGICAFVALLASAGKAKRSFRNLPREGLYLLAIISLMYLSAVLSPVWRGGAFARTIDFSKMFVAWVLTYLVVTDFQKFRRIIFIQAAAVALIAVVSVVKGRGHERLEGVLGGIYSNPNDLAFAIVLSLPFCLAFLVTSKGILRKLAWVVAMLAMLLALLMTASRGGFISLVVTGIVCLWYFGVKGRRFYLIVATAVVGLVLLLVAGGKLKDRFFAVTGEGIDTTLENSAYGSFEERQFLMKRAVEGIVHYPILGIGVRNFPNYSGIWREVHMTYLQIGVEVGIPVLILYLLFFARGFSNLRKIRRRRNLDPEIILFNGALTSSLVGFIVGALFSPEAYQFFPYFAVAFTSALLSIIVESEHSGETVEPAPVLARPSWLAAQGKKQAGKKEDVLLRTQ
jgi:O-antigen ligase